MTMNRYEINPDSLGGLQKLCAIGGDMQGNAIGNLMADMGIAAKSESPSLAPSEHNMASLVGPGPGQGA